MDRRLQEIWKERIHVFQKTVTGLTIIKNQEVSLQTQMNVSGLLR